MRKPFNQRLDFWVAILAVVIVLGLYRHHTASQQNNAISSLPPVVLAKADIHDVPVYLSALGGVTASYNVTVKTQINGQLMKVAFKEGQMVKTGDVLAEIDSRPYLALLAQYQGQLQRDQALLANALIDLKRYQKLWKQNSIAQQTLATQQSLVIQYQGAIKNDAGLIQGVKVNLAYCRITSPINGRVGLRLVDPGNIVQTSDTTGIAVINTLNPITVVFTLPEDNVPQVMPLIYANKTISVKAYDRQQTKLLAKGTLLTIDNQIDPTTGTVKLKAQFDNAHNQLFPNQFVNIQLLVNILHHATTVPTAAIQHGVNEDFVYRINANDTVSAVPVKSGPPFGNLTTITSGIAAGQSVVVEGADKLRDGIKVTVRRTPA